MENLFPKYFSFVFSKLYNFIGELKWTISCLRLEPKDTWHADFKNTDGTRSSLWLGRLKSEPVDKTIEETNSGKGSNEHNKIKDELFGINAAIKQVRFDVFNNHL